ncbi:hypothetical protein GCM10009677_54750 [Sphaerisporangium rubeum]|uniref:DUF6603 domain-containing protein n=1 Tax=Sphaerisporangium rubeum TaxID=321317 RepID=A0A7X0I9B5_9ACTN|nr:DUF6603 domain-containing protein [Sphaerisporangium rubeum]MBB6470845.1 hypothetical protein [Sphaerisporangium rubeum]
MTLTAGQLKAAVRLDGTRLDLALADLGSAAVTTVLGPFLPSGRLVLTSATRTETADGVTVTGTGAGPFTGMSVTAELTAGPSDVTVALTGTGDRSWSFPAAFPDLAGTLWDDLRFTGPRLRLSSVTPPRAGTTTVPMSFDGTLVVTTRLAVLDLLFDSSHDITGEIVIMPQPAGMTVPIRRVPVVSLFGPDESPGPDLGLMRISRVRYELLALPRFNFETADYDVVSRANVTAYVPFHIGARTVEAALSLGVADWGDELLLRADFSGLGAVSLADVARFAGRDPSELAIPFDVDITSPVVPTEVSLLVSRDLKVRYVTVTLETAEEWTISGPIVLQAVDVIFRVNDPLGSPWLSGAVHGLVGIGRNGVLELAADFTERSLGGALREDDGPLSVREVFTELTHSDAGHLPDLEVKRFEMFVTLPGDGRSFAYQAALGLEGSWPITDTITLSDVGFDVDAGTDVIFTARAAFLVGGVMVAVAAGHDPQDGWTFSGRTGAGEFVPIGPFAAELAADHAGLVLPQPLAGLSIGNLAAEVATGPGRLFVTGEVRFPIDTTEVDLVVAIDTAAGTYSGTVAVLVRPGLELDFAVYFAKQAGAKRFVATYRRGGAAPTLKELVAALAPSAAQDIPAGIVVGIDDALLAVEDGTNVFEVDLTAKVDLSELPVVGERLKGDQVVGFDPLRVLAATGPLTAAQVTALNSLLPAGVARLDASEYPKGFSFSGRLRLGPLEQGVTLPVGTPATITPSTPATPSAQAKTADDVLWYKAGVDFGPVHVARVGLAYRHVQGQPARLAVLVDAAISAGGLTLSCDGLSASVSLSDPLALPEFGLSGLGVSYTGGPVTVSGAFLANTVVHQGKNVAAYSGKAVISTEVLTIGALGSYMQLPEGPSLFVYAFLDYPIGGPAFFFVEGVAAGFGYNRRLVAPSVAQVASFPLVAEALGTMTPGTLQGELARLQDDIPPSPGDFFFAAGIHFTSFKMIDSFLLVTAQFGHRFELNVIGLSTLVLPVPDAGAGTVTPIAEIQLALKATFAPDDGYFSLLAQLTGDSYLLSRACRLTGGFAFVTWFGEEHQGDFVLTVGGYHPHFPVPSHYPSVPRLGFSWQVTPQLSMKGSAYYALTPGALMAGAALSAVYEDGSLRAWFDAAMDFLIAWQPYHYEAGLHITVGASYTFEFFGTHTISVHVGTDVRFWGPEFGGTATIDLDVISFTISFGSSTGATAKPVPWSRFRTAQLPAAADGVTVVLRGGAPKDASGTYLGAVNPAELELLTDSAVPATAGSSAGTPLATTGAAPFGVAPAGVAPGTFSSTQTITIKRGTAGANGDFRFEPVGKNLPAALWGDRLTPSPDAPQLRENLLTGYVIRPNPPAEPTVTQRLPMAALTAATSLSTDPVISWSPLPRFTRAADQRLSFEAGAAARTAIAGTLLPGLTLDLHGLSAADFLQAPEVAANG